MAFVLGWIVMCLGGLLVVRFTRLRAVAAFAGLVVVMYGLFGMSSVGVL